MKKRNVYIISGITLTTVLATVYAFLLFWLPAILNSDKMVLKYEKFLSEKLNSPVIIEGLSFRTNPNLSFEVQADKITSKSLLNAQSLHLTTKPLSIKPRTIDAQSLYLDIYEIKKLFNNDKKEKKSFNLKFFPITNIKKAYLKLDSKGKTFIEFNNIESHKEGFKIVCKFIGKVQSPYTSEPVTAGKSGRIHYLNKLYFEDLSVDFAKSTLILDGAIDNLTFKGKELPAKELEAAFLYFYKLKHPNKKNFIENFTNFKGTLDADLKYSKKGLKGKCIAHNLGADFSKFKIPVLLPHVKFNFENRTIYAKANGTFGGEDVYTDVFIEGLFTKLIHTIGNVHSKRLTNSFSSKYFKPVQIIGSADAKVKYEVQKSVDIDYILTVPKGSDLVTRLGNLDNTDKIRQIIAHTHKEGNNLYLKDYNYSFLENNTKTRLLYGEGLFINHKGHFKPHYLTLKTEDTLPVALIGSLVNDFIYDGTFHADLKYDFVNKLLSGYLKLNNTYHEDFLFLKSAIISAKEKELTINTIGTFFDSPISLSLLADNSFLNGLFVKNIDIHLNKYYVRRNGLSNLKPKSVKHHKHKDYNITVEKGKIRVDEILNPKFYLHDVEINGNLKNDIVDFTIPQTEYSKGILSAEGKYDIKKHNSNIYFSAFEIDSNEVATKMFNLPDYFTGLASASLHLITTNKLSDIKAYATFAIEDGMMPKLGSREIILNKSNKRKNPLYYIKKPIKFTLSKITNIDFTNKQNLSTDLCGCFELDNNEIHNTKIYSQSEYLSTFIKGNYNIDTEIGDLTMWGKHNKIAEKKIKILKLPLSLLYKIFFKVERSKNKYLDEIEQIPPINAKPEETGIFRVNIKGNLNSNKLDVTLKDIR